MPGEIDQLMSEIREFVAAREWQRFHTLRNLVMALAGEVGELAAELQWLTDDEVSERLFDVGFRQAVSSEVADVLTYLLRFCDVAGIDPVQAARDKLILNQTRYPVELSRGVATKYDQLGGDA